MPFLENAAVKGREFRFHPQQGTGNFFHPLSHALVWDLSSGLCDVSVILLSFSTQKRKKKEGRKIRKKIPLYLKTHHFVWKVVLSRRKAEHVCDLEIILILNSSPKRKIVTPKTPTPPPSPTPPWHHLQLLVVHFTFFSFSSHFPLLSFSEGRLNEWRWLKGSEPGRHKKL